MTNSETTAVDPRPDAFISYRRLPDDTAFVDRLQEALSAHGKRVWVDRADIEPAADSWARIALGIRTVKAFIFVITPESVVSEHCLRELDLASSLNKLIVPVVLRYAEPSGMPERLRAPNWIYFTPDRGFEVPLGLLLRALDDDLRWRDDHARLAVRADEWDRSERHRSFLLRGLDLDSAREWLTHAAEHQRVPPTALQTGYILASRQAAIRARRNWLVALCTVLAVIVGVTAYGVVQSREAGRQGHVAASQHAAAISAQLANAATGVRASDPGLAAQLDVAAYDAAPGAGNFTAMLNDEAAPLEDVIPDQGSPLALSPAGDLLAGTSSAGVVTLQSTADPARPGVVLPGTGPTGTAGGFSSDGRLLAVPANGGISLWRVTDPAHPVRLSPGFGGAVTSVAFSRSASLIATGTQQGTVQFWNIEDPARPVPDGQPTSASGSAGGAVSALTISSDGRSVYSGTVHGTVDTWNVSAAGSLSLASQPVAGAPGQQDQVSLSQQGRAVITDASGDTFLYELTAQGDLPQSISGGPAVLSPDGATIATRDQAGNITLLNTAQPLNYPLGKPLPIRIPTAEGDQSPGPMIFDADGDVLAAADDGLGTVVWHLPAGYHADSALPLTSVLETDSIDGNTAAVADDNDVFVQDLSGQMPVTYRISGPATRLDEAIPALGDNGRLLALGEKDSSVSLWQLPAAGKAIPIGGSFLADPTDLSLSADGKLLAATTEAGSVSLWSLADPGHPAAVSGTFGTGGVLALSPDGKTLAVANGGRIQLWNLDDPAHPAPTGAGLALGKGTATVTALAVSPGGSTLAVGTTAGTVSLWDLHAGPGRLRRSAGEQLRLVLQLPGHQDEQYWRQRAGLQRRRPDAPLDQRRQHRPRLEPPACNRDRQHMRGHTRGPDGADVEPVPARPPVRASVRQRRQNRRAGPGGGLTGSIWVTGRPGALVHVRGAGSVWPRGRPERLSDPEHTATRTYQRVPCCLLTERCSHGEPDWTA